MKNFVQEGETLEVTAPDGTDDVGGLAGDGVLVGSLFGVACNDFDAGGAVEIQTCGVFDLKKATPEAWAQGNDVFWDNTAERCTTTSGGGNKRVGVATQAASSAATLGRVKLLGFAI